jgi:hypothetical protein
MKRAEVYEIIDTERDYQDNVVDADPSRRCLPEHSVGDFLTMLRYYTNLTDVAWSTNAGTDKVLDNVRKIAGICVKCMEKHGAPPRVVGAHK